ncbi:MAG TPA: NAD(P)H-binding protein, partial [Solirubrobacterales bacterium]|nr:NAD(P)H-binding protein [Solirubrobacterales bacterium]
MERGNHISGRKLAVVGATGYIGRKLTLELCERGEDVRALARSPEKADDLRDAGAEVVEADVLEDEGLEDALEGVSVAYYLVHSMGRGATDNSYAERDKQGGRNFGAAAKAAGVDLIVYLGGLSDGGSEHLASRHETAEILEESGVPVTYVRAAAVVGGGSESFLIPYYLVKRLPAMVTPKWARTKTQPVAIKDAVHYLADIPGLEAAHGRELEIGGPDVTTYGGMMDAMARAMNINPRPRLGVPVLSPGLSSLWIGLVTP